MGHATLWARGSPIPLFLFQVACRLLDTSDNVRTLCPSPPHPFFCPQMHPTPAAQPDTVCKLKGLLEQLPLNKQFKFTAFIVRGHGSGRDKGLVNGGLEESLVEKEWTGKRYSQLNSETCLGGNR